MLTPVGGGATKQPDALLFFCGGTARLQRFSSVLDFHSFIFPGYEWSMDLVDCRKIFSVGGLRDVIVS